MIDTGCQVTILATSVFGYGRKWVINNGSGAASR